MNKTVQELKEQGSQQRMLDKATLLVQNKRVRRSPCAESRNIWIVSSYSTPKKWYVVRWNEDINGFVCACKSFEYSHDNMCLHIAACAIYEGGLD